MLLRITWKLSATTTKIYLSNKLSGPLSETTEFSQDHHNWFSFEIYIGLPQHLYKLSESADMKASHFSDRQAECSLKLVK